MQDDWRSFHEIILFDHSKIDKITRTVTCQLHKILRRYVLKVQGPHELPEIVCYKSFYPTVLSVL